MIAEFVVLIIALCVFGWTHRGNHDLASFLG